MFGQLSMNQAAIIAVSVGIITAILVAILGQFIKPDADTNFCSIQQDDEMIDTKHE